MPVPASRSPFQADRSGERGASSGKSRAPSVRNSNPPFANQLDEKEDRSKQGHENHRSGIRIGFRPPISRSCAFRIFGVVEHGYSLSDSDVIERRIPEIRRTRSGIIRAVYRVPKTNSPMLMRQLFRYNTRCFGGHPCKTVVSPKSPLCHRKAQ